MLKNAVLGNSVKQNFFSRTTNMVSTFELGFIINAQFFKNVSKLSNNLKSLNYQIIKVLESYIDFFIYMV